MFTLKANSKYKLATVSHSTWGSLLSAALQKPFGCPIAIAAIEILKRNNLYRMKPQQWQDLIFYFTLNRVNNSRFTTPQWRAGKWMVKPWSTWAAQGTLKAVGSSSSPCHDPSWFPWHMLPALHTKHPCSTSQSQTSCITLDVFFLHCCFVPSAH